MKTTIAWLAWAGIGMIAALAALNWGALLATTPVNLFVTEVHLPWGLLLLTVATVPPGLFFVAYLQQKISTLTQTRGLLKELHRAHELADKAEASRVAGLQQLLTEQFRVINDRLDSLGATESAPVAQAPKPNGLRQLLSGPWKGDARPL